uniref:Uncharacterized protein n=1 Tax=Vitis vinifera TaxID=29760 RepID=F6H631_VITVI
MFVSPEKPKGQQEPCGKEAFQLLYPLLSFYTFMEALRDADINRIGVWGMGGVGKSTLVKRVAEEAEQEELFHKVVTASVFQTPDYKEIQQQIAEKLGMKFEEVSEQGRAGRLHQRIKQENTILIILDDLWAELELEKVGIPSPDDHKGCKLVLTSRNKQVLSNEMSTQKDFRVQHLQEDETWILFKNTAGDSIENPELQPIAVDVVKECAGLPIAIVTVAKALKNKNVSIWKDALQQLNSQTSTNITGMETKVAFPNLEELELGLNRDTEIWPEQFPVDSFPRLRVLDVCEDRDILVVIPSFMLQILHNLEVLNVGRCSSVNEVFQLEGLDEENQAKRLGRLREIELYDLPGLTHLWKENSKPGLDLQGLESLVVRHCVSLINLVPSSVSFQNLATLDVQSCGSLRSLISPSVAKSLVKLKTLKIGGSDMMEEVVANEGGEATDEITFYKLQHMELLYLPTCESIQACQMMEELLGQVMAKLLEAQIHEEPSFGAP